MSPHEMTSARIEEDIAEMEQWIASGEEFWEWRLGQFKKILKERAEDGTYHDDTGRF